MDEQSWTLLYQPLVELGLIGAIGEWVIEEMCRQDVAWRARGVELELSFNVSARQLQEQKLAEKILDPFASTGSTRTGS